MAPTFWLIVMLGAAVPLTYGTMWLKQQWAVSVAYKEGKKDGAAEVTAKGVAAAGDTAAAIRDADATTPLPADKAAIVALCKQRASCRERGSLK